jgi:uncharacterized protein involved in exopolysaccharide biosynthesis
MGNIRPRKITELLAVIWQRKAIIILIAAAMLLATILIVNRLPDVYESRGLVIVSAAAAESPVVISQITATTQQLNSYNRLSSLVSKYRLYPSNTTEDAISILSKSIKTEIKYRGYYPDGPESYKISYRHSDPQLAQQVVTELVQLFDHSNELTKKQAGQDLLTVNEELTQVESQLQEFAASNKQEAKTENGPKLVVDSVAVNTQRMATVAAIEGLNDKQFTLEQQITTLKKEIADQQKLVKQTAPPSPAKSAQGPLLVRKAELEAELKSYATQYTEKNPKVIAARQKLDEVNRQLANLSATPETEPTAVASLEAQQLRANQRELTRLETELEVTRRDLERKQQFLAKLPAVDPTSSFTRTETATSKDPTANLGTAVYSNLSDRYRTLLSRREGLQKVSTGAGVFQVLDRPTPSQVPVGPNRLLLKLIGLALGLVGGLVIAFALEVPRLTRIQDERDVDYLLGAPVLALIPETLTTAESSRVQRLQLARGLLVLLLAGALIPAFYLLLKGVGIFQILGNR